MVVPPLLHGRRRLGLKWDPGGQQSTILSKLSDCKCSHRMQSVSVLELHLWPFQVPLLSTIIVSLDYGEKITRRRPMDHVLITPPVRSVPYMFLKTSTSLLHLHFKPRAFAPITPWRPLPRTLFQISPGPISGNLLQSTSTWKSDLACLRHHQRSPNPRSDGGLLPR